MTNAREAVQRQQSEAAFQGQVLELARVLGWRCYFTWRSYHSPAGFPDLVLLRPPRLLFIELKSERGVVTPDQDGWLADLGRVPGAEAYVFRPSQWDELVEVLNR
jgi:hypothetical protein